MDSRFERQPPGVVGAVDVGVDDEARLLEPEPHIPDIPEVSSIPEDVAIPAGADGTDICDDVDVPGVVVGSPVRGLLPRWQAPRLRLPFRRRHKLAVDPYIPDGEVS